jgi:hypothetical protein
MGNDDEQPMQSCSPTRIAVTKQHDIHSRLLFHDQLTQPALLLLLLLLLCSELEARTRPEDANIVENKDCQCKVRVAFELQTQNFDINRDV